MKFFTLFLIIGIAFLGFFGGYRLITGRDLVSLDRLTQADAQTAGAPESTPAPAPSPAASPTADAQKADAAKKFEPWWVQNFVETDLWSGSDANAVSFGKVPKWSYFQVVSPQEGPRLHVLNPVTQNYAYIDAAAVGPSSAPPSGSAAPSSAPNPSEPQQSASSASSPTTMVVGNTGGMGVYVRRTPNMGDKLRAWPDNTPMQILDRNISSGGREWMKVRSPDGAEGYVPEAYLVAR